MIPENAVAVVGLALRVPGAHDVEAFWRALCEGREAIRRFAPEELDPSVPESLRRQPNFVAARAVLEDAEAFDAAFFGLSAREAVLLDPQQRLLLELSWHALEHAGVDPARHAGAIGVYAGVANNSYLPALKAAQPELVAQSGDFATMLASEKDYVATRIAHRLDLKGPAISVHTACSTSLVAIAQAWYALRSWQCDLALAGGATVLVPQHGGYLHVEGGMESADGRCRPFDAQASGTVFGSGAGMFALKRLEDALADGDTVHAVIRGVGLNNDGGAKASFTAPSVDGQAAAIGAALALAGVAPEDVEYIETHGTGTALGDPIEVAALAQVYGAGAAADRRCGLGSVKSNLGHLIAAAGAVGLAKAVLAVQRGVIPPTLHFAQPNPQLGLERTPFQVVDRLEPWTAPIRRAGVSSFGVGGTNAHVIVESPPPQAPRESAAGPCVLALSAQTADAVSALARALAAQLEGEASASLADVAFTLAEGRARFEQRIAVAAHDPTQAARALREARPVGASKPGRVVFLFPGQGAQVAGMGRILADEPVFRDTLERLLALAEPDVEGPLRAALFAAPDDAEANAALANTALAQPALFCVEYALAEWLEARGLRADAMIGHSIGEWVAATRAGVFTEADAIALVARRGALMQAQPRGAMLALGGNFDPATLPSGVEIAGYNAPDLVVVAGPEDAIVALAAQAEREGRFARRLRVSHAFHSAAMDGALESMAQAVAARPRCGPLREFYGCVDGAPLSEAKAGSAEYWARQIRAPVRFADAVATEIARGAVSFVEVGPGQNLSVLVRRQRDAEGRTPSVVSLDAGSGASSGADVVARLWAHGLPIEPLTPAQRAAGRRVPLPLYPFRRERHWFRNAQAPADDSASRAANVPAATPLPVAQAAPPRHAPPRKERLANELAQLFAALAGVDAAELPADASFLDLGFDSLQLTQAALELERRYGLRLRFRRLMEDLDRIEALVAVLDASLPPDPEPEPESAEDRVADGVAGDRLARIEADLAALRAHLIGQRGAGPAPRAPEAEAPPSLVEKPFGASARIAVRARATLDGPQATWLAEFTRRYNRRTARSKAHAQQHRAHMADPRVVTGFDPQWKELVYPVVVSRSRDCRLWDLDGNEYIDLLSGFGSNFLGYRPREVTRAMARQLREGIEIGPQHPLAGEVAEKLRAFVGLDRVAFCNTGSEAVMGAMRAARTVTGRRTIAIFNGSYHGIFDEVIVRGTPQLRSIAAAPGILANAVENVLVLDYGSEESLKVLRSRARELAAILIEPVQSRNPGNRPREFVQALRAICDEAGCALIFDEVITGFRIAPGGAQQYYGVRADLATYGKIIGGGLPLAAIAGGSRWMDAFDGGFWRYGDESWPEAGVTYFAGTFVRHPLALAAAKATLEHLERRGPALQRELDARAGRLADELRAAISTMGAPFTVEQFSSILRLKPAEDAPFASLLYYLLRHHGLHLYEQFGWFLTEAHDDAAIDRIVAAARVALREFVGAGLARTRATHAAAPAATALPAPAPEPELPPQVPLTDGQTEKWLAGQGGAGAELAFNESFVVDLEGPLDEAALASAWAQVSSRHEALRLRFAEDGSAQWLGTVPGPLLAVDLSAAGDPEAAALARQRAAMLRAFDLARGPLIGGELLRLGAMRHKLLIVAHHLVCDGWSAAVLLEEIARVYTARVRGTDCELPAPGSWRRYVLEERERRRGERAAQVEQFWRDRFAQLPEPLELPADRARSADTGYGGDTLHHVFDARATEALRAAARRHGVTLYSFTLAATAVLLSRLSGQQDFVVGVPFAGQALSREAPLVGDGVNSVPLRLAVPRGERVEGLVRAVHGAVLDAAEHQDTTLLRLLGALNVRRQAHRVPLVDVIYNFNPRLRPLEFAGLAHRLTDTRKTATPWDLFFNFNDLGETLTLDVHYATARFATGTVQRWIEHLAAGLAAFATAAPGDPVDELDYFGPALRAEMLRRTNDAELALEAGATVPSLILRQAERTPERIAAECGGSRLRYGELAERSARVAAALNARGVGEGHVVGVCVPRSLEALIALLGVLRSGAAYVPLDPGFPPARLALMAERADAHWVLARSREDVPAEVAAARRVMTLSEAVREKRPRIAPSLPAPDSAAYVLFTSGSTGVPKGVRVSHRNLVHGLLAFNAVPALGAEDVVAAISTLSFDIAAFELFGPLTVGARAAILRDAEVRDPAALVQALRAARATVLQATPTRLGMLVDAGLLEQAGRLRLLIGGEVMPVPLAAKVAPACAALHNVYGPTETTLWATQWQVRGDEAPVPLGRPLASYRVYVVDEAMRPVLPGAVGEIVIGGAGVSDGYVGMPAQTAERFVPDPFGAPGARCYRTGDRGRLVDGVLHFVGRSDAQVKLRGFRVELPEIEAVALAHPTVREAAAVVHGEGEAQRLVLHVAAPEEDAELPARLRTHLAERLPDFMLPQRVVVSAGLPHTPTGKIDRRSLHEPQAAESALPTPVVAPRAPSTPLEEALAAIWRELLQVGSVGVDENFFDLGGHSLLAVRMFHRAEATTGVNLPLSTLFAAPTIAALARAFADSGSALPNVAAMREEPEGQARWAPLVPMQPKGSRPPLFFMHAVGGNVLNYLPLVRALGSDQPAYGLQSLGLDGVSPPLARVEDMARAYLAEIRAVQPHGPYYLGGGSMGGLIAFEIAQQLTAGGEQVALLAMFDTYGPGCSYVDVPGEGGLHDLLLRWSARLSRVDLGSEEGRRRIGDSMRQRLRNAAESTLARLYRWRGRPVPHALRYRLLERRNLVACERYRPRPYAGAITLFRAQTQPEFAGSDETLGWNVVARGGVEVVSLPGTHADFIAQPALGRALRDVLARAQRSAGVTPLLPQVEQR